MLPKTLIKSFDKGRLRNLLLLIFLALAVPTTILIWQAYSQLKWEAFHQYRGAAEELTGRIDTRLNDMVATADANSFADYAFLIVSGDPSAKFVQRSPLSVYPVTGNLPGVLGYFQVDTNGVFSTPLLPPEGTQAATLGISDGEYGNRLQLAQKIQTVLANNHLVQSRQEFADRSLATVGASFMPAFEEEKEADDGYSQGVFDQLNQARQDSQSFDNSIDTLASDDADGEASVSESRLYSIGKVSDLKLDANLQKKSEEIERVGSKDKLIADSFDYAPGRGKRREQIALPEAAQPDAPAG